MNKYYISIGEHGGDFLYDVVSDAAYAYWSKRELDAIENYVFENDGDDFPQEVPPIAALPRWGEDGGQRFSGSSLSVGMTINVGVVDGGEIWTAESDDIDHEMARSYREIYPENGEHAVLAYTLYKGEIIAGEFTSERPFDQSLLKFDIVDLWGDEIVTGVYYDGERIITEEGGRLKSNGVRFQ